ncbi:MAG TPA: thermonuclease family protein [Candidatus Krumholzibacteria bacterium]|nr:thermonuclease family protein [Candidatus Krumholzibacteria bacterium]
MRRITLARVFVLALVFGSLSSATALAAKKDHPQPRTAKQKVDVPLDKIRVSDGDTMVIDWAEGDRERVRVLGIDTPEIAHEGHFLTEDQPHGQEAREFATKLFAQAKQIQLLRADQTDTYGRTLGFFFLDGKNYSPMVLRARLAYETVSHYGDNGFPEEAAECLEAAKEAQKQGELDFEQPYLFRRMMREREEAAKAPKSQRPSKAPKADKDEKSEGGGR